MKKAIGIFVTILTLLGAGSAVAQDDKASFNFAASTSPNSRVPSKIAEKTVTIYVPGLKKIVTGQVGVPLETFSPIEDHPLYSCELCNELVHWSPTKCYGDECRSVIYGSGVYEFAPKPFLSIMSVTAVTLPDVAGKGFSPKRGGLRVDKSDDSFPLLLKETPVIIWAIDGYSFTDLWSMVGYLTTTRKYSPYAYVEVYLRTGGYCGVGVGCQSSIGRDKQGRPVSRAMIVQIQPDVHSSLYVAGLDTVQSPDNAKASLGLGHALLSIAGVQVLEIVTSKPSSRDCPVVDDPGSPGGVRHTC